MSTDKTSIENESQPSCLGAVMRCFILFHRDHKLGLTTYYGIVINSKEDADKIAKKLTKDLKVFVDYKEETRILNNA